MPGLRKEPAAFGKIRDRHVIASAKLFRSRFEVKEPEERAVPIRALD